MLTFISVFLSINTRGGEPLQLLTHAEAVGGPFESFYSLPDAPSSCREPAWILLSHWQEIGSTGTLTAVKNVKMSK